MKIMKATRKTRVFVESRDALPFVLPALAVIFIFFVYPIFSLFYFSVRSVNFSGLKDVFVGLENYKTLFTDLTFIRSITSSLLFMILGLPIQLGLALFLAVQVNKKIPGTTVFRTIFFVPVVVTFVVVAILWKYLYNPDVGLINAVLTTFHKPKQMFLSSMDQAFYSLLVTYTWKTFGFYMMIYISGLQGISSEIYEASSIDGANNIQKFFFITFPLLKKTNLFVLVIGSINIIIKSFVPTYIMTEGGPRSSTTMLVFYVWKNAFKTMQIGYASSAAVILFVMVMLITVLQFAIGDKDE